MKLEGLWRVSYARFRNFLFFFPPVGFKESLKVLFCVHCELSLEPHSCLVHILLLSYILSHKGRIKN
jgi:hypothetical protein